MAKYRVRKIAGVRIANPQRIIKKVARAPAYALVDISASSFYWDDAYSLLHFTMLTH